MENQVKKVQLVPIEKLVVNPKNPRKNEFAVGQVVVSMETYGFINPIVVDENWMILAGHTRHKAAKRLQLDKVPVVQISYLTEAQKSAFNIADNKTASLATWDDELLKQILGELKEQDYDLTLTAFDDVELRVLMGSDSGDLSTYGGEPRDETPTPSEDTDAPPASTVRMVQLYLSETSHPVFTKWVDGLAKLFGTSNVTETVYKAMEKQFKAERLDENADSDFDV